MNEKVISSPFAEIYKFSKPPERLFITAKFNGLLVVVLIIMNGTPLFTVAIHVVLHLSLSFSFSDSALLELNTCSLNQQVTRIISEAKCTFSGIKMKV